LERIFDQFRSKPRLIALMKELNLEK